MIFWVIYFILQIVLPIRHYFIAGDVLWTEEGHRMSWRMMLRGRSGSMQYIVKDKATGSRTLVNPTAYLTPKQQNRVAAYPDFIWQFAQRLKKEYQAEGKDVAIYARSRIRVNSHPPADFIDSSVDLARESWDPFRHHNWILCSPLNTPKSQSSE